MTNCHLVLQTAQKSVSIQQIRFRSKINIQRPKPFHHERGKVMELLTPIYANPNKGKKLWEVCISAQKKDVKKYVAHPYEMIIAREILNWFNNSKMIGIFHMNSIKAEDNFNFQVRLKKHNMYTKNYGYTLMKLALTDTIYEPVLKLFLTRSALVFSPDVNVQALVQTAKKTPELTLLAGILNDKLLHRNEFLEYGKMDLTSARVGLVSVLQNAGGNNLNRQLTHHQSTLVTRLEQISTAKSTCDNND
ncbi:39S ribosomal protein L10, mitochondrial isoform X2 [Leptopilina boulardi]|uniref:39S ribosomal protein L10, mitochondrial isoform X2 n=1 Tax=Leptopilina boulardi TaxID=63433 RepID=UPI0021F668AD|nr:39S ribosomal protein L10, mitochondrial isoform X2 [Leptopilina boulardi]